MRVDWSSIFGVSLTERIMQMYKQNYTRNETMVKILNELRVHSVLTPELAKRVRIGVSARYGEIRTKNRIMNE